MMKIILLLALTFSAFGFSVDREIKTPNDLILDPGGESRSTKNFVMEASQVIKFNDVGSNTVSIAGPINVPSSYVLLLPDSSGVAEQILFTNGSGVLEWRDIFLASTDNKLLRSDTVGTAEIQESGITVDDSNNITGVSNIIPTSLNSVAIGNYLTTTNTKTVTNKKLDGLIASTSNQWTPPENTTANLTALCPSLDAGSFLYSTDENKYYLCNGAVLTEIGAGGGGVGGSTISEWIPFPAITTWDTILGVHNSFYRRVGGDMEITFNSNLTVNPSTSPLTSFFIDLPIGYTIDLTQMRVDQDVGDGAMLASMSSAGTFKLDVMIGGATSVYSTDVWDHIAGIGQISNQITDVFNYNFAIAPGIDFVQFTYRFPVNEWAASIPPVANGNFFHETVQPQNMLTVSARIGNSGSYFVSGSDSTGALWLDSVATGAAGSSTLSVTPGTFLSTPTCTITPHTILAIPSRNGIAALPFIAILTYSASTLNGINTGYDIICTGEKAP